MINPETLGQSGALSAFKQRKLADDEIPQTVFEVAQKKLVIPAGQQLQNMVVVSLQMLKQVQKDRIGGIAVKKVPVLRSSGVSGIKDVAEELLAEFFQEKVLGLKMGIEGGTAYISPVDDLAYGDLSEIFFGEQVYQSGEDGFPGFSLSSIHKIHHTLS